MEREELIRVASKRLYFDHSTDDIAETAPEIMTLCEKFAEIALDVFEKAHTPTAAASEDQVQQRDAERHTDHEEHEADDGAATGRLGVAGSHAKSMAHAPVDGKRGISIVPTDDEREALTYLITAFRFRERGLRFPFHEADLAISRPLAEFLHREGFRRSEVPEPSAHDCTWACGVDKYGQDDHAEPQGEPSDAGRTCGPCSRGQHAPCDGPNEFWGDCTCACNATEPQGEQSDLSAHVEQVAYADDSYGTEDLPENYERHYCDADGEDWPCAAIRGPQGEPSDAALSAAIDAAKAFYDSVGIDVSPDEVDVDAMRAALRAAGGVR